MSLKPASLCLSNPMFHNSFDILHLTPSSILLIECCLEPTQTTHPLNMCSSTNPIFLFFGFLDASVIFISAHTINTKWTSVLHHVCSLVTTPLIMAISVTTYNLIVFTLFVMFALMNIPFLSTHLIHPLLHQPLQIPTSPLIPILTYHPPIHPPQYLIHLNP